MKFVWNDRIKNQEEKRLHQQLEFSYKEYLLTLHGVFSEKETRWSFYWVISSKKAPFDLTSKKRITSLEKCRISCEDVFKMLIS